VLTSDFQVEATAVDTTKVALAATEEDTKVETLAVAMEETLAATAAADTTRVPEATAEATAVPREVGRLVLMSYLPVCSISFVRLLIFSMTHCSVFLRVYLPLYYKYVTHPVYRRFSNSTHIILSFPFWKKYEQARDFDGTNMSQHIRVLVGTFFVLYRFP